MNAGQSDVHGGPCRAAGSPPPGLVGQGSRWRQEVSYRSRSFATSKASSTGTGTWGGWQQISPAGLASPTGGTHVTYAPGSNGSLQELFVEGPNAALWMDYQT